MSFYDQVLRELVFALGAALFVANGLAVVRRRRDRQVAAQRSVARARPGSPVRGVQHGGGTSGDLAQAPLGRTLTYMAIGLVVMLWGLASMLSS